MWVATFYSSSLLLHLKFDIYLKIRDCRILDCIFSILFQVI